MNAVIVLTTLYLLVGYGLLVFVFHKDGESQARPTSFIEFISWSMMAWFLWPVYMILMLIFQPLDGSIAIIRKK